MAEPAMPADVSASDTPSSTHQNSILDHLDWWMNSRPLFRGVAAPHTGGAGVATSTFEEIGHGVLTTAFATTPITNTGAFTVAASANPSGLDFNVEVPDAGYYEG